MAACRNLVAFSVFLAVSVTGVGSRSFIITNNCAYTVWPGILSGAGQHGLRARAGSVADALRAGRVVGPHVGPDPLLRGRPHDGQARLRDGRLRVRPRGVRGRRRGGMDFYDVSLVDGYNLPLLVAPQGGNCAPTGCMVDLNGACPADLRVTAGGGVACRSACEAFGSAQCCCSGEYGNPNTCKPTAYSQFFKNACPSYAYDDATSTFTCGGAGTDYSIAFCPNTSSVKSSSPGLPLINNTMTYFGGSQIGAAGASRPQPVAVLLGGVVLLAFTRAFF